MARHPEFRLALIGAGRMGQTHLRALAGNSRIAVADVVEPVPAVRERLAATGLPTYPTIEDLLATTTPDGILITAPTGQHGSVIAAAAKATVPVLCEKPAGLSCDDIRAAGQLLRESAVAFQVAYWRRFVPALQRLRERVASGALGDLLFANAAQWDGAPPAAAFRVTSGGIFVDMGVHEFDELRWLTGQDISQVSAVAATQVSDSMAGGDVDSAQALLGLSGGSTALVSLGRHHPGGDMASIEVFGSRGHERLQFLDPAEGETAMTTALVCQAEAFAELVRTGRGSGAGTDDAVAALTAAAQASRSAGLDLNASSSSEDLPE